MSEAAVTEPRPAAPARRLSLVWALLPLLLALPAAPCFAWAAWRLRSRRVAVEAAGYLVVTVVWVVLANGTGAAAGAGTALAVVAALVATARAFALRARLFAEPAAPLAVDAPGPAAPADAGWIPVFPAERLRAAGRSLAGAVACDGHDRHRLTMPPAQAAGIGLTGLGLVSLDAYLHVYNRSLGAGIGLLLASVLIVLFGRSVDGPMLIYRRWGRVHRLPLTSVTAVSAAASRSGSAAVLLAAPGLARPLRLSLRSRGYVMSPAARDHLRGWLSAPHVRWTPEAQALFAAHWSAATVGARRRHRLLALVLTAVLPLVVAGAGVWLAYRGNAARAVPGFAGYRTFAGPRGKPLPVGRPWGRPCRPIRFAVDRQVPAGVYAQIAAVVGQARRDGLDVTLESRSFSWSPGSLYYVDGETPADAAQVGIFGRGGEPPRLANGRLEHIRLGWDATLDPDGRHEDLTTVEGDLWLRAVEDDPRGLRRAVRQLIALTQGIAAAGSDSGIASGGGVDRFTPADVAAMKRMSGCG